MGDVNTYGGDIVGRDKIIINITQGIGDLPTTYEGAVKNFLSYYLGSDAAPAPFGGRDDDLQRLDDWLNDRTPYALLAAPAGRGKSALLVHWLSRLRTRTDIQTVFFPISIRYSTNRSTVAFASLAARLAHLHSEKVSRANDAQEYRAVFNDYLARPLPNGKTLLIVLDALDEAAGWETSADLFPNPPRTGCACWSRHGCARATLQA